MKEVYTLADLREPDSIFVRDSKPARLAVIGDPVVHSKSPQLHQPALDALGLNCTYVRIQLSADEFAEGVDLMKALGFIGCNVTVPHKERALAWATNPDSFAAQLGVANTILFQTEQCFTTDPVGCESAVAEQLDVNFADARILVIGAGGGAGSAVAQYIARNEYRELYLHNRSEANLASTVKKITDAGFWNAERMHLSSGSTFPSPDCFDLIINATSLGLKPEQPSPILSELLNLDHSVYDMTYGCENALSKVCKEVGARYADGMSMLAHQGAAAFKIWFPGTDPLPIMGR